LIGHLTASPRMRIRAASCLQRGFLPKMDERGVHLNAIRPGCRSCSPDRRGRRHRTRDSVLNGTPIRTHQKESVSSTKSPPVFDFANVGPPSESVGSTGLDALLQDSREAPGARGPSSLMPRHPIRSDRLVVQRPSMDGFSSKRYRRDAFATGTPQGCGIWRSWNWRGRVECPDKRLSVREGAPRSWAC
jgi:hypothetical protein